MGSSSSSDQPTKKEKPEKEKSEKSGRNYDREYKQYYGEGDDLSKLTQAQRQHRLEKTARNRARRIMKRTGKKLDGKDVDHVDRNPLNNDPSNLRVQTVSLNRSRNSQKSKKRKKHRSKDK